MKAFLILNRKSRNKGFTLIEMIGVLAVIAILASLLIPKIYEAINNSRVSNAAVSYNTVKTALADHFAKFGSLLSSNGAPIGFAVPGSTNFDLTLLAEGFLDKPFQVKIGDSGTHVEIVQAGQTSDGISANNSSYDLDGSGITPNDTAGSSVVQAVITGVTLGDAFALSTLIDGPSLSAANSSIGSNDLLGRVKYSAAAATTTVYIYVTHR